MCFKFNKKSRIFFLIYFNTKGNTNWSVTKLLIISGIIWYVIPQISIYTEQIFDYMH